MIHDCQCMQTESESPGQAAGQGGDGYQWGHNVPQFIRAGLVTTNAVPCVICLCTYLRCILQAKAAATNNLTPNSKKAVAAHAEAAYLAIQPALGSTNAAVSQLGQDLAEGLQLLREELRREMEDMKLSNARSGHAIGHADDDNTAHGAGDNEELHRLDHAMARQVNTPKHLKGSSAQRFQNHQNWDERNIVRYRRRTTRHDEGEEGAVGAITTHAEVGPSVSTAVSNNEHEGENLFPPLVFI